MCMCNILLPVQQSGAGLGNRDIGIVGVAYVGGVN